MQAIDSFEQIPWDMCTEKTLVAFDVDHVLLQPIDPLFCPMKEGFAAHPLNPLFTHPEAGKWLSLLYQQIPIKLTEDAILDKLAFLKDKNVPTLAITAMPTPSFGVITDTIGLRLKELQDMGIHLMSDCWPKEFSFEKHFTRSVPSFREGVIFSAPHEKGVVLKIFLEQIKHPIDRLLFIDDQVKNIHSIQEHFPQAQCYWYKKALLQSDGFNPQEARDKVERFLQTQRWA